MRRADHIIDLGPGAGMHGGEVVVQGTLREIEQHAELGDRPLPARIRCVIRPARARRSLARRRAWIEIRGAHAQQSEERRRRAFRSAGSSVITGISGSGKSTLMRSVLLPAVRERLKKERGKQRELFSTHHRRRTRSRRFTKWINRRSARPRARRPATYIKVFDEIRKLFAQLPVSRVRGYSPSRFSFNTEGGRCETCSGPGRDQARDEFSAEQLRAVRGLRRTPLQPADARSALQRKEHRRRDGDDDRAGRGVFRRATKRSRARFRSLVDTGLGYLKLGQPSPTLSGGEAQRLKLATELTRGIGRAQNERLRKMRKPKSTLYLLEEPTIGLHMADVELLLKVLHRLVDEGNTVIVIEHNLSVIAEADYVVDIGPEAGAEGGEIVADRHAGRSGEESRQPDGAVLARCVEGEARGSEPRARTHGAILERASEA